MAKIIGPGSLIVDVTGFAPHLPVAGETVRGAEVRFGPGGKGGNQITAAHRAGSEVYIIGRRGDDVLGAVLKNFYDTEKMSQKYIGVGPDDVSGAALIEIDQSNAQNRIIVILNANEKVGAAEVEAAEEDFATADVVLTQFETTTKAVFKSKELAAKYNIPFILNPAPFREVPKELFDGVDYVTPNETEAEQYTGIKVDTIADCKKAADVFFEMGVKNVIITLGSRGSYFTDGKRELVINSIPVKPIETTGAGDAFNGGFATAIAEGADIETALQFANCTATISVTRLGAGPSMPGREEILDLMNKEYGHGLK